MDCPDGGKRTIWELGPYTRIDETYHQPLLSCPYLWIHVQHKQTPETNTGDHGHGYQSCDMTDSGGDANGDPEREAEDAGVVVGGVAQTGTGWRKRERMRMRMWDADAESRRQRPLVRLAERNLATSAATVDAEADGFWRRHADSDRCVE